jgi:hypothetical protein
LRTVIRHRFRVHAQYQTICIKPAIKGSDISNGTRRFAGSPHMTRTTHRPQPRPAFSFDALEPRQLMSVDGLSASWSNAYAVDFDEDGAARSGAVVVSWDSSFSVHSRWAFELWDKNTGGQERRLFSGEVFYDELDFFLPVHADLLELPTGGASRTLELEVRAVDPFTRQTLRVWTAADLPALGGVRMERGAEDGGAIGSTPLITATELEPNSPGALIRPFLFDHTISADVSDADGVDFGLLVAAWVDVNNNGVIDDGIERSTVAPLTPTTVGAYSHAGTFGSFNRLPIGMFPVRVIAWDWDGNVSVPSAGMQIVVVNDPAPVISAAAPVMAAGQGSVAQLAVTWSDNALGAGTMYVFNDADRDGVRDLREDTLDARFSADFSRVYVRLPSGAAIGTLSIGLALEDQYLAQSGIRVATASVVAVPQIVSVTTLPALPQPGVSATFAASVADPLGLVGRARFRFFAADGSTAVHPEIIDTERADGWSVTAAISSVGGYRVSVELFTDWTEASWTMSWASTLAAFRVNDVPRVTAVTASRSVASAGQSVLVSATIDDTNPRAVTFFRDVNENGIWDAGIDQDLGADFNGSDGWSRLVAVQSAWIGRVVIAVDVVDTDNVWGAVPLRSASFAIAGPPAVSYLSSSASVVAVGGQTTISAIAGGVNAIRAVTFFRDVNENGAWDFGIDQDLGADFTGSDGWSRTITVPPTWAGRVFIIANAVDVGGVWGVAPLPRISFAVAGPPAVSSLTASASVATWGDRVTLTALAGGQNALRAVSFFFDADGNGRWTPGTDEDLGADFTGADGWSIDVTIPARWSATAVASFAANVVDVNGVWGSTPRSVPVRINDVPVLALPVASPPSVAFGGSASFSVFAADAFGIRAVTMFVDVSGDGRWTPGVDIDLGLATRTSGSASGGQWTLQRLATWGRGTFTILADAVDTDGRWSGRPAAITLLVT